MLEKVGFRVSRELGYDLGRGYVFEADLSDSQVRLAYSEMVRGNVVFAQDLAKKSSHLKLLRLSDYDWK